MPSPSIRCRICGHKIHPRAAKCGFCGKVYRKSGALYFAMAILVLIATALFIFSLTQGQQRTRAAEKELEQAAKDAGLR